VPRNAEGLLPEPLGRILLTSESLLLKHVPFDVVVVGCAVALEAAVTLQPAVALKAVRLDVIVARAVALQAAVTLQPAVPLKAVALDVLVVALVLVVAIVRHFRVSSLI